MQAGGAVRAAATALDFADGQALLRPRGPSGAPGPVQRKDAKDPVPGPASRDAGNPAPAGQGGAEGGKVEAAASPGSSSPPGDAGTSVLNAPAGKPMKRIAWDQLPPGFKKSSVVVVRPDGSRVSEWDYEVEKNRKLLAAGKLLPQSRWEICDWVEDPKAPGQWIRAWDSHLQTGWFSSTGDAYRKTTAQLDKPNAIPKGPHIITPDEAKDDGKAIPSSKLEALVTTAVKTYIRQFPVWQPLVKHSLVYPIVLVELFAAIDRNDLRQAIAKRIWASRQFAFIDTRTHDDVRENVVAALVSPLSDTMQTLAHSCAIQALYPKYLAALPAVIAAHQAKHPLLGRFAKRVPEVATYLAYLKTGQLGPFPNTNEHIPRRYQVAMASITPAELTEVGQLLTPLVSP